MLRLITSPAELIKTQQQLMQAAASSAGVLSSSSDLSAYAVTRRILRDYGVRGLFRGITSTALRDIGYGTYFGAYEATVRYWPRTPTQKATGTTPWLATLVAGGLAGIAGWVVTFPFDVVKTRVQSTFSKSPANPYRNTWSTTVASYRAEGVQGFFRGLAPTLIRSVLRTAISVRTIIDTFPGWFTELFPSTWSPSRPSRRLSTRSREPHNQRFSSCNAEVDKASGSTTNLCTTIGGDC